ncbi:MAG: GNAT family N-acetyltransferase [Catenulispora sp.]
MDTLHSASHPVDRAVAITRVAEHIWHALEDDQVVGRGDAVSRSGGRLFISVDAWQDTVFDRLVSAMLQELPRPLHVVVDEADAEAALRWGRAGFVIGRRETGYLVPTDPHVTGLGSVPPPADVTIVPAGGADEHLLRAVDRVIREEVAAAAGWHTMPAEVIPLPPGVTVPDPAAYAVAAQGSDYVAVLRLAGRRQQPRIGLLAVRADQRRRGIGRALLAHSLGALHDQGTASAWAEVDQTNTAAVALFEGAGARPAGGTLELVRR